MIHVLVDSSSPDWHGQIAALIRDDPNVRLIENARIGNSDSEHQRQPDVVIVPAEQGEPFFESFAWNASGVPIILILDNAAQRMAEDWIEEGVSAGVRAVLPRNLTSGELIAAIEAVAAGLFVFHPAGAELFPAFRPRESDSVPDRVAPLPEPLTPREIEVLQFLSSGLGNKEIASRLNISEHTAKFHVASIMGKLGAGSRTEAVTLGIRHGLVLI